MYLYDITDYTTQLEPLYTTIVVLNRVVFLADKQLCNTSIYRRVNYQSKFNETESGPKLCQGM